MERKRNHLRIGFLVHMDRGVTDSVDTMVEMGEDATDFASLHPSSAERLMHFLDFDIQSHIDSSYPVTADGVRQGQQVARAFEALKSTILRNPAMQEAFEAILGEVLRLGTRQPLVIEPVEVMAATEE